MDASDRLFIIVIELQQKGWLRAADLAATLKVSSRTIYRDVEALIEAGVPVVGVPGKGYRLNEGYFLTSLPLTTDEAVLLWLNIGNMDQQLGTNYRAAAAALRKKLGDVLPDRLRSVIASEQQRLRFDPINVFDDPTQHETLRLLRAACGKQRAVRFEETRSDGGDGAAMIRTVRPYALVFLRSAWYLVGYSEKQQRVRHFHLDRMQRLELLDTTFERPASYSRTSWAEEMPREAIVRVIFDHEVVRWARQVPSTFVAEMADTADGLLVTLYMQRETEVMPWLLSWGAYARVLEPASLQRRLAREAKRMAAHYQPAPTLLG